MPTLKVATTTQADEQGIAINGALTITVTVKGRYLIDDSHVFVSPPELGDDPTVIKAELDRWAHSRGFVPTATNHYRPI